jgi:hypothetical protein
MSIIRWARAPVFVHVTSHHNSVTSDVFRFGRQQENKATMLSLEKLLGISWFRLDHDDTEGIGF